MSRDRVKEISTTSGEATTVLLDGPVSGYRSALSGIGAGNSDYFEIIDGIQWMQVYATVQGSPARLEIVEVIDTSNNDTNLIDLSGNGAIVFCALPGTPSHARIALGITDEFIQDIVGTMFSGNTETGITVDYQDGDGTIDFVLNIAGLTTDSIASGDFIAFADISETNAPNKITFGNFNAALDHGLLSGLADDDHPQYPLAAGTETISGAWTFSNALNVNSINGIDYNPGSDTNADLITVGVTGSPVLSWNESADRFNLNKGIQVTSGNVAIGTTTVLLSSTFTVGGNGSITGGSDSTGNVASLNLVDTGSGRYAHLVRRGSDHATEADDTILYDFNGSFTEIFRYDFSVPRFQIIPNTRISGNLSIDGNPDASIPLYVRESADNAIALLESTFATSAGARPLVDLHRNGGAPSANHIAGALQFSSRDSANNYQPYSRILSFVLSPTDGAETGYMDLQVSVAASLASRLRVTPSNASIVGDLKCGDQTLISDTPAAALHVSDSVSNAAILTLTGTANDANPVAVRYERTKTGVTNDVLIDHLYIGKDDAANNHPYVRLRSAIRDAANGSEDGVYQIITSVAGTERIAADFAEGIVFRNSGGGLPAGGIIAAAANAPALYESGRKIGGTVHSKFVQSGNVGTGVDTLNTITVPAALLFNDGDSFVYKAAGVFAATANNKELVVKFGGVTLFTTGVVAINDSTWDLEVRVIKDGTDSYRAAARMTSNSALITTPVQITASTALDLDAAQTFLVTGEATADNDIVVRQAKMNFNPA